MGQQSSKTNTRKKGINNGPPFDVTWSTRQYMGYLTLLSLPVTQPVRVCFCKETSFQLTYLVSDVVKVDAQLWNNRTRIPNVNALLYAIFITEHITSGVRK